MENPNDEKNQSEAPSSQNPPPYSDKEPSSDDQQYPLVPGPVPYMGFAGSPGMPHQYQPYSVPYGVVPGQGPITQPPEQTTVLVPTQTTHEPDYLVYSIFTMICCCLPLGVAALIFSILTRDANQVGDSVAARRNSRKARSFAHSALGVGLVFCTAYIVYFVLRVTRA